MTDDQPRVIDRYSEVWRTVYKWATDEIDAARLRNDSMNLDADKTLALRSRIKTLKELIDLPESGKRKELVDDWNRND
jgi:hypothetical protein